MTGGAGGRHWGYYGILEYTKPEKEMRFWELDK